MSDKRRHYNIGCMEVGPLSQYHRCEGGWSKMKWVIFVAFLVQGNCISSQPTNDNVRETRQLQFDECCPCPTADRLKDSRILGSNNVPSDCPCRTADSETASSIFTPTLQAVQSFVRPLKSKNEPQPLLNPEVGLASSVLETLREVTDLEYQEALARDVARSALQVIDSDPEEIPVIASKNIFNNILGASNKEAIDVIPEASNNEETRCIHPTLNRRNEFGNFEIHPQKNLFKNLLLSKPAGSYKNIFDMDNSPSDIQENIVPVKNGLLDDIKIKTNLLKSKLFGNNKGLSQKVVKDKPFEKLQKLSDWKLVVPLNNLKSMNLFDSHSPPLVGENAKEISLSRNNLFKNNLQNNKKIVLPALRNPQQSTEYKTDEALSSPINYPESKEVQGFRNTKDNDIDFKADTSILNPVLSLRDDCNLQKENILRVETTSEKNDNTNVIDANPTNVQVFIPLHNGTEILDTIPNPPEIMEDENQFIDSIDSQPYEDGNMEINIESNPVHIVHNIYEENNPTSITNPTDIQDTSNNLSIEENNEETDKYIPEVVCTTENSKSEISSFYIVSTPEPITTNTDVFNFAVNQNKEEPIHTMNAEGSHRKEENTQSHNHHLNDNSREDNIKIFPNIKEGIIKTFENVKSVNEKLQEKIQLNIQDALQLVNIKNNVVMQEQPKENPVFMPDILDLPYKSNAKQSTVPSNTLSSHELQRMSDSILTLSSVDYNSEPKLSSSDKEISHTVQKMDNKDEPSETITCFNPAEEYYLKKSTEKKITNKNLVTSGSESNKLMTKKSKKSENLFEKSSLNIKVPSSGHFNENEMSAQASEQKPQRNTKIGLDKSRYLKQDFVLQPNNELNEFGSSLSNVNNFFDNVKSTISNVFTKTNDNIFRQTEDDEDEKDNNYKKNKQYRALDLEKPKLNLIKNANSLKDREPIQTETMEIFKSNINPYKARVAVPESFNVKPILTLDESVDKRSGTSNDPRNILPKTYFDKKLFYNSNENFDNDNLRERSLLRETKHNSPNSESTILSPNIFNKNFRSTGTKNQSRLKDRTDEALQNIYKTLGNPLRAIPLKEDNRFINKNVGKENLFETMVSRRNELNEKLQAINLDLNDRLFSLSHRMADSILPSLNSQPQQRKITPKSRSDVKTEQGLDYLRRVNVLSDIRSMLPKSKINPQLTKSRDNLSMYKPLKKSLIRNQSSDLISRRLPENILPQRLMLLEPALNSSPVIKPPKTETKRLKSKLQDKKMVSVTTTTRPITLLTGLKRPQTITKVSSLIPKTSVPFSEKKTFISRLKSGEPHSLGSENIITRVLLDKKNDSKKSAMDVSSDESEQQFSSNIKDVKASKQEVTRNLALTKLREALKNKIVNRDSNNKDINLKSSTNTEKEIIQSASENVNKEIDGSLRQNVQYKCKMLCSKDD